MCESAAPSSLKGKVKNVAEGFRRVQLVGEERRGGGGRRRRRMEGESKNGKQKLHEKEEEIVNIHSTK